MMDQKRLWDYYQGEGVSSFDGSIGRLSALLKLATDLSEYRPRVLNIGTGNGWLEQACKTQGWDVTSLDPSQIALANLARHGIAGTVGFIEAIPLPDSTLDIVFCSEVLEHLTNSQLWAGLREIRRTLRQGGYLIGSVPFQENLSNGLTVCPHCGERFHRWGHHQSFDRTRMQKVLSEAGFTSTKMLIRAFPYFPKPSLTSRLSSLIVSTVGRFGFQSTFPSLVFIGRR